MYDVATYFAWFVIAVLFLLIVAFVVAIGSLPKWIAVKRNHPQVDAINAASWIALAFGGVAWPIVFVWAFLRPSHAGGVDRPGKATGPTQVLGDDLQELRRRVEELQSELASLKRKLQPPS